MKKELANFKKLVKNIVKESHDILTQTAFRADERNQRYSGIAVNQHQPAIRATPVLDDATALQCLKAILMQKSHTKKCIWMLRRI